MTQYTGTSSVICSALAAHELLLTCQSILLVPSQLGTHVYIAVAKNFLVSLTLSLLTVPSPKLINFH